MEKLADEQLWRAGGVADYFSSPPAATFAKWWKLHGEQLDLDDEAHQRSCHEQWLASGQLPWPRGGKRKKNKDTASREFRYVGM